VLIGRVPHLPARGLGFESDRDRQAATAALESCGLTAQLAAGALVQETPFLLLDDVNLAAAHCDHIVVMKEGAVAADGPPQQALDPGVLGDVYGVDLSAVVAPGSGRSVLVPTLRRTP